ncbi:MAG: TRAP transporter small permease subunit [Limnohabitans sp.]|nr:TRAP transporter small permease subunit [Limnohabitans sp.]
MHRLNRLAQGLGGVLFLALFLTFLIQIAARFGFQRPLPWTDELAVVLYLWVILWASAFMVREREHVVFDLLWNAASLPVRRVMKLLGHLLLGSLALMALPGSWDYVRFMAREGTPVLGWSFQWVFMPFMFLLLAVVMRSAWGIWQALRGEGLASAEPGP